ncbi:MAG TPA: hypothetical protein ENH62_14855 [Marinobacter sp.]|nr:hypothetical protein [Marinobacter sp.]
MIPQLRLTRAEERFPEGTFGWLRIQSEIFCATLEPPDLLNAASASSIPAQQYICERYSSSKYPDTFQIMNVPGRDKVLFHAGNRVKDTEGCVILAAMHGKLYGDRAVLNSGKTFKEFMRRLDDHSRLHLTIDEHY